MAQAFWQSFLERLQSNRENQAPRTKQSTVITISLIISCILWFTLSMRETYPDVISVPTEVVNIPEGLTLQNRIPEFVKVQVEGQGWQLLQLVREIPTIRIDARQVGEGESIDLQQFLPYRQLPEGVSVISISPQDIAISFNPKITKKVPILLKGKLEYASTFGTVRPPRFEPDSVLVSGPANRIDSLQAWYSEPQFQTEINTSIKQTVGLESDASSLLQTSIDKATLLVEVDQFTEARRRLIVEATELPKSVSSLQFSPAFVEVVFSVPLSQYQMAIEATDFRAFVPYEAIQADTSFSTVRPRIQFPKDVVITGLRFTPNRLSYSISVSN